MCRLHQCKSMSNLRLLDTTSSSSPTTLHITWNETRTNGCLGTCKSSRKKQSPKWNWLNHTPGCGARKSTMAVLTTFRPALACLRVPRAMYSAAANPLFSLQGKTALITGGARDIGQGCAIELARAGADVCINYNASAKDAEVCLFQITCTK